MRLGWLSCVLLAGCIEYQPKTTLPEQAVPNPRELDPTHQIDTIVQSTVPQVDVLWLVDNSSSMEEEQIGIAANFPVFLDYFIGSGLDYHIGVISTDMYDTAHQGRLVQRWGHRWIDPLTQNPQDVLSSMTLLGTGGSGDEKGRDPIFAALNQHKHGWNQGFYRESAGLHVIVISDEEDSSDAIGEEEFLVWMENLKWGEHELTFSSIVAPDPICPGANDPGVEYIRYTERLGGIYWPICDDDWAVVLEQLGIQAASLDREYFLSQIPIPETLEVYVEEGDVTFSFTEGEDWVYEPVRNSIIFSAFTPEPLMSILIEYDVAAASATFSR